MNTANSDLPATSAPLKGAGPCHCAAPPRWGSLPLMGVPLTPDHSSDWLWIDIDGPAVRHDLADILVGHRPRPNAHTATQEATGLLATHPGCLLVLLPLPDGDWLAASRTPAHHAPARPSSRAPTRRVSSALTVMDSGNALR
ncbi:hypothetical protein [Streptomyces ipomoeae]|uniref:hypothetical protein n=2 Tax=Streptomyces ipomoeae TaxID=103232 RepID=UPI0029B9F813|nr:hypothetical protein [Streptomyces ipomoeae]MDX2933351.1 hypothetical protein [Streptomyces ipomoeae]